VKVWKLAGAGVLLTTVLTCGLQAADPKPQDATQAILAAFDKYQVVAIHAAHRFKQNDDYILSLIRNPAFAYKVNDIVVECGNKLYQEVLDRYIAGEEVALSEVRPVWRNTTQLMCGLSAFYEQLFPLVREVNQALPNQNRLRVLAADPAFDWSKVKIASDVPAGRMRDPSIAAVMKQEVLAKKRKALMLFGIGHLFHGVSGRAVTMYEQTYPALTFVVAPHMGLADERRNSAIEARIKSWPNLSLASIKDTWIGDLPMEDVFFPPPFPPSVSPTKKVLSEFVDAYLYLGPLDSLNNETTPAYILAEDPYMAELRRRANLGRSQFAGFSLDSVRADNRDPRFYRPNPEAGMDRVLYIGSAVSAESVEAAAALIAEIAEIREIASDSRKRAVAVRGSIEQIALAEWLAKALGEQTDLHREALTEYRMASGDDIVRIYYFSKIATTQSSEDFLARIRSSSKIRQASSYGAGKVFVLRGTAAQLAAAQRQIK
jgi:hypothetical protein